MFIFYLWALIEKQNILSLIFGFCNSFQVCEFGGDDCIHTESTIDKTLFKYRDLLVRNIEKVVQKLSNHCHLEKLQVEMSHDETKEGKQVT